MSVRSEKRALANPQGGWAVPARRARQFWRSEYGGTAELAVLLAASVALALSATNIVSGGAEDLAASTMEAGNAQFDPSSSPASSGSDASASGDAASGGGEQGQGADTDGSGSDSDQEATGKTKKGKKGKAHGRKRGGK